MFRNHIMFADLVNTKLNEDKPGGRKYEKSEH